MAFYRDAFLFCLLGASAPGFAVSLENSAVRLDVDSATGSIGVTLKESGRRWERGGESTLSAVKPLAVEDGKIAGQLKQEDGAVFDVEIALGDGAQIIVRVLPVAGSPSDSEILYPPAFRPEPKEEIAAPHNEGVLVPVTGFVPKQTGLAGDLRIYEMRGTTCAWAGVADLAGKGDGYATIVRTPYDALFRLAPIDGRLAPQLVWKSSKGSLGHAREAAFRFFPAGGYVAMAKAYRDDERARGHLVSLREKMKINPKVERMIGGPQIWLWADALSLDFVRSLHDAGIQRGFICISRNETNAEIPANWFEELDRLGYLAGVYESVSTMHDPAKARWGTAKFPPECWPGAGILQNDGKRMIGFANQGERVCTIPGNEVAAQRFEAAARLWPAMNAIFIDVDTTLSPMECHDPAHPMTCAEDIAARGKRLDLAFRTHGWVVSSETGNDWASPFICSGQGAMTLSGFAREMHDKKSPFYDGGWAAPEGEGRPSTMLRTIEAPPNYLKYGLNPANRAPLYELAAHDCIVQTWRWNDTSHKIKGAWRRKDLLSILYGTAPMWNLDKPAWEAHKNEFIASYRDVCDWHRQVGLEAMTAHGFLTPDRMVQYSIFGNGRAVIVNFGSAPWTAHGATAGPESFLKYETAPEWLGHQ